MEEHPEAVSVEEIVGGIFDEALSASLESSKVDPKTAKRWTEDRLRRLSLFDRDGIAPDLRENFAHAIRATKTYDSMCVTSAEAVRLVVPIGHLTKLDVFERARKKLYAIRAPLLQGVDESASGIQKEVYIAMYAEIANPTEVESFADLLDWWFRERSDLEKFMARMEGSLLIANNDQLQFEQYLIVALAYLNVVSNNIFYHTVIKKHGSKLEAEAAKKKVKETLSDVKWEAFSKIPGVGDLVGPLKILSSLLISYADSDRALEDETDRMIENYESAKRFIELYIPVISTWGAWKVGLMTNLTKCIKDYLSDFMPFGDIQKSAEGS